MTLRLFVSGGSPRSARALARLRQVVDGRSDAVTLEVVDVLERPDLAERDAVLATPTLLRLAPAPVLRVIGELDGDEGLLAQLLGGEAQLP